MAINAVIFPPCPSIRSHFRVLPYSGHGKIVLCSLLGMTGFVAPTTYVLPDTWVSS
jgi:hypothetical protein